MINTRKFSYCSLVLVGVMLFITSCTQEGVITAAAEEPTEKVSPRIVTLDGMLTELLYCLDLGEQVVGIDITSTYPNTAREKPQLGHVSQLNTEAILALSPNLIICKTTDLNNAIIQQLATSGVEVIGVRTINAFNNSISVARQLQKRLPIAESAIANLQKSIQADSIELTTLLQQKIKPPKTLFLYARGTGRLFVSGTGTPVASMIEKAGGENAVSDFSDYKELSPEALIAADPEVILLFDSGLQSLDGMAGLGQIPGISQTKAFTNKRVITMDGQYLSSFGPRAARAAYDLASQFQQRHIIE